MRNPYRLICQSLRTCPPGRLLVQTRYLGVEGRVFDVFRLVLDADVVGAGLHGHEGDVGGAVALVFTVHVHLGGTLDADTDVSCTQKQK